jgi:hypothetical protein
MKDQDEKKQEAKEYDETKKLEDQLHPGLVQHA